MVQIKAKLDELVVTGILHRYEKDRAVRYELRDVEASACIVDDKTPLSLASVCEGAVDFFHGSNATVSSAFDKMKSLIGDIVKGVNLEEIKMSADKTSSEIRGEIRGVKCHVPELG